MTIKVAILTISDRSYRGERDDRSGPALVEKVTEQGWKVVQQDIVPDNVDMIANKFQSWSARGDVDLVLSSGGTGFAPRDVTPEATEKVVERRAPGLAEAMRAASLEITPHAMLSRARAGIRQRTLIVNLPGSPKAALENLAVIIPVLPHAVELLQEDPRAEEGHREV